ncbi:hypothetical protein CI793_11185 [Anoxybacillus ayderensis]|uniref:fibronectin type III domain-containing protein n=1 Tax=Anoxybacillus gonensis TaxID=198467 RepID=UPI00109F7CE8|nr:hypothetical protein [Anoxybacillus gonensis]THD15766.1 hypothetical protein CI793_11185 [Anoxybacillus ayderensis]
MNNRKFLIKVMLFSFIVSLVPTTFANANTTGILYGKQATLIGISNDYAMRATDGLSTYIKIDSNSDRVIYNFPKTDLTHIYYNVTQPINIKFYSDSILLGEQNFGEYGTNVRKKDSITYSNVNQIVITKMNSSYTNLYEIDLFNEQDLVPPSNISNLSIRKIEDQFFEFSWNNPNDIDFAGTKIYVDDVFKGITSNTFFLIDNLSPNTTYTVRIVSFDTSGNESDGVTATVKTKIPIVNDVTDLQADAKYDRVKLSWTPPESEFFHHVKIYRKKVEQQSFWDQLFGTTAVSAETTSDGYTPMFETNGTYWTDLTVKPETTYSYKVTSVNIEGNESQGVTIETTTPSEPVPVFSGVATTQNENGDYVVTWTSPTKGAVKLLIEGREYAQVDAATKQIIVRKEDMKTDFFGAYAATLIPIGEYGTKGQAVNVPSFLGGKIDFPLSFQDLIETTISILAWVAPFILLSLTFIFWKPIFNFIKKAISERRVKQ